MMHLKEKVAIVTGASAGIGKAIALCFAAEGARVVIAARRTELLECVARSITDEGGQALVQTTDVTHEDEVDALFTAVMKGYGRVDILINNAGVPPAGATEDMTLEQWRRTLDVNLTGAFLCSRAAIRIMKSAGGGRIINIGSVSSIVPRLDSIAYTASKAALEGMTRSLTLDGRRYGIVASIVRPGVTASDFNAWRGGPGPGKLPEDYIMEAADLARVVALMCAMPPEVNLFEATLLPNHMNSFIGRG